MAVDASPTARALLALETIQNAPGITAEALGDRLGVSERAARRYVAILREADLPVESATGPFGGYRVGRGLRLAPLTFTSAEAMGLVMAVLAGHRGAADPADLVGGALAKILRVLPERIAAPVKAFRENATPATDPEIPDRRIDPDVLARLIESCVTARRLRVEYRMGPDRRPVMEVDPWAVVLWRGRWYLLCWSHAREAQRVLRVDRMVEVRCLLEVFVPPVGLDAMAALEDHMSRGWTYAVDVLIDAPPRMVACWLPRSLGRLEPEGGHRTRLLASTDEPEWYARQLGMVEAPFEVVGSPEIRQAVAEAGRRMMKAAGAD